MGVIYTRGQLKNFENDTEGANMKNRYIFLTVLYICLTFSLVSAVDTVGEPVAPEAVSPDFVPNPVLTLQPVLLAGPITVDGIVDSLWKQTTHFANFTEFEPSENKRPQVATGGYVAYDPEYLYVAFVCNDPQISQLRASLTDRDKMFNDDWVCVSIDPDNNGQKAYQFYVNARGVQGDKLWQANGTEDESFDLVWSANAQILDDGWTAELKIPFESLRFPNREKQSWRVHFTRQYPRENQYKYSWMPISANNSSFMGQGGKIEFKLAEGNAGQRSVEILPYLISTQNGYRSEDPADGEVGSWKSNTPEARAGFGLKYGFSSSLTADFTYNPDFSQIESDAGQISVNNPFALFFDEKRPFFQEGNEVYAVDLNSTGIAIDQYINFFYSRSINDPLLAGKVSGKSGKLSLGYTSAYDRNTPYIIPFEERTAVVASVENSYSNILRAKYDLGNQSSVGLTLTDRRLETDGSNSVAAIDAIFRLSEQYTFSAIAALTQTREPDNPALSSMIGNAPFKVGNRTYTSAFDGELFYGRLLRAKLNRNSRHWVYTLAFQDFSPGFRADNGFFQSNSLRAAEYIGGYFFRFENNPFFTSIRPRISLWRKYNYEGVVKDTGIRSSIVFNLRKQTVINLATFIFNRENLYGKQFGDARLTWFYIENNALKTLSANFFISTGKQINRLGRMGDPHNPFELVPGLNYNWAVTFKPVAQFSNGVEFQEFNLWTEYGGDKIVGQRILRNSFSYQLSRRMLVRLIGEFNIVDRHDSGASQIVRQKFFTLDPLFSYKLNAFSVFYLGGHFGAKNNFYLNWDDIRATEQSLFVKFQYLFRS